MGAPKAFVISRMQTWTSDANGSKHYFLAAKKGGISYQPKQREGTPIEMRERAAFAGKRNSCAGLPFALQFSEL